MTTWIAECRAYVLACMLALAAVIAVYAGHFRNAFHFDDVHTIENNGYIRELRNIPMFFRSARTFSAIPSHQSYRPLVTTTLAIDYRIAGGLNPIVFHATSFLLFAAQCVAMLFLLRRLLDRAQPHRWNRWLALFAVSWYALHTAIAETVNYVIARSEIMSTLGSVLALLLFSGGGRARRWKLYLIPAAAAVLSKEQGAMAALLLFFYAGLFECELSLGQLMRPRQWVTVLRATWPAIAMCGMLAVISVRLAATFVSGGASRLSYLLTQPFVLLHYALTFIFPLNLSADTDWKPITNPFDDRVLIGAVFIACALSAALVTSRRRETRPIAFGIVWFFLALLPTSSIIPLAEVVNDHRMYFPFAGVVIAAACILGRVMMRFEASDAMRTWGKPAVVLGCMAILAAHAYGTHRRNLVWRTDESLWLDVTQKSPENGRGLMNYGLIQMQQAKWKIAEEYFERALQYAPYYSVLHVNMGILKDAMGKPEDAEHHFKLAQQYDPGDPVSYFYYARWLYSLHRGDDALAMVRRALELSPANLEANDLIRQILAERQELRARTAREIAPEHWVNLSLLQFRKGDYEDAIESGRQALRLRPDYAAAYNNICAAENARGAYEAAADACRRALALQPGFTLASNNLAFAISRGKSKSD